MHNHLFLWKNLLIAMIVFISYEAHGARKKGKSKMKLIPVMEDVNLCEELSQLNVTYTYLEVDDVRVNLDIYLEGTYSDLLYSNDFARCESATQTECEGFVHFPIEDFCEFLEGDISKSMYGNFIKMFSPTPKCPLHGRYISNELNPHSIGKELMNFASGQVVDERTHYRWTHSLYHKPTNKTVFCLYFKAYLKYVRV